MLFKCLGALVTCDCECVCKCAEYVCMCVIRVVHCNLMGFSGCLNST